MYHALVGDGAGHELVGSIVEYLTTPHGLPAKLAPGAPVPDTRRASGRRS